MPRTWRSWRTTSRCGPSRTSTRAAGSWMDLASHLADFGRGKGQGRAVSDRRGRAGSAGERTRRQARRGDRVVWPASSRRHPKRRWDRASRPPRTWLVHWPRRSGSSSRASAACRTTGPRRRRRCSAACADALKNDQHVTALGPVLRIEQSKAIDLLTPPAAPPQPPVEPPRTAARQAAY